MRTLLSFITLFALLIAYPFVVNAQQWTDKLPQKTEAYTLYDYQKAFNEHWEPLNVQGGYFINETGERQKAPGWKQFKRWEWYWQDRVDPITGAFPQANRIDIYQQKKPTFPSSASRNSDGNWTSLGPNSSTGGYHGLGRINTVGFREGDNNTFYAGSPSGGLWKTTDGGSTWTVLTDDNDALGVSDIIVIKGSSAATDTIFIGTGDRDGGSVSTLNGGQTADNNGIGILKSFDGGANWSTTDLTFAASEGKRVSRMLPDPNNDSVMIVSVLGLFANQGTVYQSTDRGLNFSSISNKRFIDMEYKPESSDIVYGSTHNGEIWKSTDGANTWAQINLVFGDGRVELAVSPNEPTWVYAVVVNSTTRGLKAVWKSIDSGGSWAKYYDGDIAGHNILGYECDGTTVNGQGEYDLCIAADPTDANNVFIGGVNTWRSTNGGLSWTISNHWSGTCSGTATTVHADKHFLGFQPGTNHVFEGNDGGIYKNETGNALDWDWIGDGMAIGQLYRMGVGQLNSGTYIAGLQDNGSKAATGDVWSDNLGGDGMESLIDFTDESIQYTEGPAGKIVRTTDNWANSTNIYKNVPGYVPDLPGDPTNGSWVTPIVMDPNDHSTLYMGYGDLWKSTNKGDKWAKIYTAFTPTSDKIHSIAVAPSNSQVIYLSDNDSLGRTENGGTNWTLITGTLPVGSSSITYIAVSDTNPDTAWVSMGQYNANGVFQTTDGGTTWKNISTGLPQVPVMCVVQYKYDTSQIHLYAATDIGVYVKVGKANWSRFSNGMPNVVVTELEIYYDTTGGQVAKLRASTYGRGLWESDVFSASDAPVAEFEADNVFPSVNKLVKFTDLSENVPTGWEWSFDPNTVTYQNGTDSSSTNPEVFFTAEDTYTVTLVDSNSVGKDTEIKTNYITVSNMPTGYCTAKGGAGFAAIERVQFGTIDNTPDGTGGDPNGYSDYTDITTSIHQGDTLELKVNTDHQTNNTDTIDIGAWIDWNRDGIFDHLEKVACVSSTASGNIVVDVIAPAWAEVGKTRMRVRSKWFNAGCGEACGETPNGEVEDYGIEIIPGIAVIAPVAGFTVDNTTPGLHHTVIFTDTSTNLPQGWSWSISPTHFSFVDGTNAASANPHVTFSTATTYTVELEVQNTLGSDIETKTNYITVQSESYCQAGSNQGIIGISKVDLNGMINNTLMTTNPLHYEDFTTSHSTTLTAGNSYNLVLETYNPQAADDLLAWIDWNSDGDFDDANEELGCAIDITTGTTFSFTVPADALLFPTVLRVRAAYSAVCGTTTACGITNYGEVEDYRINIQAGTATWAGTTSDDWSDATNWNPQIVPGSSFNVTIPSATNSPVISSTAECKDLTVNSGISLDIAPGGQLTVDGDLVITGANFTIQSDATGNGSLIVKGTITGTASVERYLGKWNNDNGDDGWHIISAPITDEPDIGSSDFAPGGNDDFYAWSESEDLWKNFKTQPGGPDNFIRTEGYLVAYVSDLTGGFSGQLLTTDAPSISGLSVVNDGWHLRGNPYPSAITWNTPFADWGLTNIGGVAKIWNESAANYADIGLGDRIPSTNGFFVQSTVDDGGSFTIPATSRIHSSQNNYKQAEEDELDETLVLTVSGDANTFYDVTRVGFREDATEDWDIDFDSHKLFGRESAPQLWSMTNDDIFSWNNLPYQSGPYGVPLYFRAGVDGTYKITAEGVQSFYESSEIYLEDLFNEEIIKLNEQTVYSFTATTNDNENRFMLHFHGVTSVGEIPSIKDVQIYSHNKIVYVKFSKIPKGSTHVEVFNTMGRQVTVSDMPPATLMQLQLEVQPGIYIVRLQTETGLITQKVIIN